ncbi:TlpA family protein disulfide reductase [Timonella sp. A28]|uniref:TlpA family protein disulfide reductase n=1 Tax=Timonella sp. A28 TaxID=3442640 RepID=UPI003EBC926B
MIRLFSSPRPVQTSKVAREKTYRRPIRRIGVAAIAAVTVFTLTACAQESGNSTDVVDQGYQSGDGSVRTWPVSERGESVVLTGTDFEGNPVDTSEFDNEIVVLNTWYAACPPCRAEAPDLLAIATERDSEGVHFVGINRTDEAGAALAFEREFGITWPSIQDTSGQAIATLAGVVPIKAVPTTVVLDKQGRVAARVLGQVEKSTLNTLIDDVLAENA